MAATTNLASPFWIYFDALDTGFVLDHQEVNICCPTCGPYILASVETYLKYAEAVGTPTECCKCCNNIWATLETYLKFAEAVGEGVPAAAAFIAEPPTTQTTTPNEKFFLNCTNNFENEIQSLKSLFSPIDVEIIKDKGIVESGSLNSDLSSNISDIQNLLVSFYTAPGNLLGYKDMLSRLLDLGLVVECLPGQIRISSVETYLSYAEANGGNNAVVPA